MGTKESDREPSGEGHLRRQTPSGGDYLQCQGHIAFVDVLFSQIQKAYITEFTYAFSTK